MKAVEFGHTSIVQLLVDNGADINSSGDLGQTAVSVACERGNGNLVKYLLDSGARPSHSLTYAIHQGSLLICQLLLDAGAEVDEQIEKEIPLIVAATRGNNAICQLVLDFGADVNQLIKIDGRVDPIYPTDALTAATMWENFQTVELLLSHGALIRGSALAYSITGLEDGILDSHREICYILIQHGADMNPDLGGFYNTPLAMALHNDWLDIARCMISKGARVDPSDPTCLSAGNILVEAVCSVEMTREILGMGVDADSPIAAVDAWAYEIDDDACDFTTALQAATYYRNFDTVNLLLESGANPNIFGPPYGSPLFSLVAGACFAIENVWPKLGGEAEKETYNLNFIDKTAQIYMMLQERHANNVVPLGSLNYRAFCECVRGMEYLTGVVVPNSIDKETFDVLSGGIFYRVVGR
ncbi:ankyrin repeat-containing domain protein [Penicillium malachiteum]|uniref:ankyrin repeat-containing domain protein n=1 Tax=Penicillium malachiteum TaxID=1324776 RepID=UPI0025489E1E|nr:ankyrin repeat-containing domain protein [Penicillium malachiteum]KAJ5715698.1 ankyrin repeat-containing domain protein [Penicillium malachiteum]